MHGKYKANVLSCELKNAKIVFPKLSSLSGSSFHLRCSRSEPRCLWKYESRDEFKLPRQMDGGERA